MGRSRSIETRQPMELRLAGGVSVIWLCFVLFYAIGLSTAQRADPTWVIVFGTAAALAWVWAISAIRRRNAAGKTLEELWSLTPDEFEEWTAARFRDLGYSVKVTGKGGDHGADLVAEKVGETAIVQCKRYKAWSVGEPILRDLLGAMHDFGVGRAYLVTTGHLTEAAAEWVKGKPIEVWDGEKVAELSARFARRQSAELQAPIAEVVAGAVFRTPVVTAAPVSTAVAAAVKGTCPRCGSALVERRNRRTGDAFLGCSTYPRCHHSQPLTASSAPAT